MLGSKIVGNGPRKVVALHSWLGDHSTYVPMIPYLDTEEFTYAFADFRGYGQSQALTLHDAIDDIGADILALTDSLGWPNFHVLGHSMGGLVAQWLAAARPERIRSLALLTAVPARGFPMDEAMSGFFGAAAGSPDIRAKITALVTANRYSEAFIRRMVAISEQGTQEAIAHYLQMWTQTDIEAFVAGKYTGPVKAFVGEFDPVITAPLMEETVRKNFPQSSIGVVAGAAHYPSLEAPCRTAAMVESFFLE